MLPLHIKALLKGKFVFGFIVPEDFCYDPTTKSYGEPTRRPEIKSATYEFIAPSEYMVGYFILALSYSFIFKTLYIIKVVLFGL